MQIQGKHCGSDHILSLNNKFSTKNLLTVRSVNHDYVIKGSHDFPSDSQ